jgi:hypothetical protein
MMRRISIRRLAPIAALALAGVAVAGVARAAGGGSAQPRLAQVAQSPAAPAAPAAAQAQAPAPVPSAAARALRARARAVAAPLLLAPGPIVPAAMPLMRCRPGPQARTTPKAPPSDALKNAFGILRRERNDDDALPAKALAALKARGLEPVDSQAARLLRADRDARAWAVPVPDVNAASPFRCVRGAGAGAVREGLAVVALNGAPGGGGGALRDLQRGIAPATVDLCAGTERNMLGVSGIVPDGVEAVFVTAADGSATRADVRDNGYAFVLPRPRRPQQRYLVWTGSDGTPHVQPLDMVVVGGRDRGCPRAVLPPRVTPDMWGSGCGQLGIQPVFVAPARPPRVTVVPKGRSRMPARRRPVRPLPLPLPLPPLPPRAVLAPCAAGALVGVVPRVLPPQPAAIPPPRPVPLPVPRPPHHP